MDADAEVWRAELRYSGASCMRGGGNVGGSEVTSVECVNEGNIGRAPCRGQVACKARANVSAVHVPGECVAVRLVTCAELPPSQGSGRSLRRRIIFALVKFHS